MEAAGGIRPAPARLRTGSERLPRLHSLASDERLVKRIRSGSDAAFEALYERYHRGLLSFCRHMLGSPQEAEDAVQQSFVNAYRGIVGGEQDLRVRPWLYRIARNQCISMLRARRQEVELGDGEPSAVGLAEEVAGRSELRELLRDLERLPPDQREALLLAELHDNSHADVAEILGCEVQKVKALVFQARSSLLKSRQAREASCAEIQQQLSALRGGALRRTELRRHMADCVACRSFYEEVKRQRAALALVLPVAPSAALKLGAPGVLAAAKAAGLAGGGAGAATSAGAVSAGGLAAGSGLAGAGAGGTSAAGSLGALAAKLGASSTAVKAAAAALALTAAVGGTAGVEVARHGHSQGSRVQSPAPLVQPGARSPAGSQPGSVSGAQPTRGEDGRGDRQRGEARTGHRKAQGRGGRDGSGRQGESGAGSNGRTGAGHGEGAAGPANGRQGHGGSVPRHAHPQRHDGGRGGSRRGSVFPGGGSLGRDGGLEDPGSRSGGDSRDGGSSTQPLGPLG